MRYEQPRVIHQHWHHSRTSALLASIACFVHDLPLFFSAVPKTPLRVLCIIAFDTLHTLRNARPMPRQRAKVLASLLDFGACTNASLDGKRYCVKAQDEARQRLREAGLGPLVDEYVSELQLLESHRPSPGPGGDDHTCAAVRAYRESVASLSLEVIAAAALDPESKQPVRRSVHDDDGLEILFRIVMQCQIIDDVIDYSKDSAAGLPGFLTASASLAQALKWAAQAADRYSELRAFARSAETFPLRLALIVVSAMTRLILRICQWHCRNCGGEIATDKHEEFSAV